MHNQGDILLLPMLYSDLSSKKMRPVIVLSNRGYNNKTDDLIVACVTSNLDAKPYTILITNKDMEDGAILRDSYIRADKISTISQGLVVRRVGRVKPEIIEKVKEKIMSLMDDNK